MESPGVSAMRGDVAVEMRYLDPRTRHNREAAKSLNVSGGARADSVGVTTTVHDARSRPEGKLSPMAQLQKTGFGLAKLSEAELSAITSFDPFSMESDTANRAMYKQTIAGAVRQLTDAAWARSTSLVLRRSSVVGVHTLPVGDNSARGPVNDVHCDFTPDSMALGLFRQLAEGLGLGDCPFMVVNVWRNVADEPVQQWPMAVCDASSVAPSDLIPRISPENENTIYNVLASDRHRWFTYSALSADEMLLFKQFDSDDSAHRFTPHTAFDHPRTISGAPTRQSCEVRVLCFFDPERKHTAALRRLAHSDSGVVAPEYTTTTSKI